MIIESNELIGIIIISHNGDGKIEIYKKSKKDAHFRLAYPILTITLPLIAVVSFFCFPNSYSNQVYIISTSLLLSLFLQLLLISMRRVIIINPTLWFIFYLIPIIPICVSLFIIFIQDNFKLFGSFKK